MAVSTKITFGHRIEALGFDAYLGLFGAMGLARASAAGAGFARALGPLTGAHRTALRNLRLAFPDESEAWRRDVARAMWDDLGRTFGEFPHMHEFRRPERLAEIEVVGAERYQEAARTGAVFIAGHFSNWEIMAIALVESGVTCHVTYRPANNPIIDKRIIETRRRYGVKLQAAKGREGGMALIRALKRKETVVLMNDQKYNEGVAAPLFGHDCMTADGPARLAIANRVPLIPFSLKRLGGLRFRSTVHEAIPIDYEQGEAAVPETVRRVNAFMEARIREAPEQWFWVHRRWPKEAWEAAGVL
ncbi:MAG: lysophospholipid acyltransferase family protein [Hydrogenophilaceae bacterium]|jgi:KDO2-lipid IV(A) lauroyltransferase|nr:lysophospholipid acyltransferase family protein [Hydrogenophilaceae bacterium]